MLAIATKDLLEIQLRELASTRATIAHRMKVLEDAEKELEEKNPVLYFVVKECQEELADLRKDEKRYADRARELATDSQTEMPGVIFKFFTVVDYVVDHAIKLATVFCPDALKLDSRKFESWVKANEGNTGLLQGIVVRKVRRAQIASDLSMYLPEPEEFEVVEEAKLNAEQEG